MHMIQAELSCDLGPREPHLSRHSQAIADDIGCHLGPVQAESNPGWIVRMTATRR